MRQIPHRVLLAIVLCLGTINLYSQRICLSIAVICMTNHTAVSLQLPNKNFTNYVKHNSTCIDDQKNTTMNLDDGPFVWDSTARGLILGVFFWGYVIGQIPIGWLTQKFGARLVVMVNLMLMSVSTTLLPLAAHTHLYLFYTLRVLTGISSSAWFPGFYQVWAAWAPPDERGLLVGFSYAGIHIGNAITLPITAALCRTSFGWPSVFYFYGAFSFIYALLWILMVYDAPRLHPRISQKEKKYLLSQCGDPSSRKRVKTSLPIKAVLTSIPVWAFVAINLGFDWNGYTFLTSMPAYMREVLQFDIQENAGLSAVPYVGLWLGQLFSGLLSDWLIARKVLSVSVVRKLMTGVGMFGPGVLLIVMSLFDCRLKYVVVALFTCGLVLNSGVFSGGLLNPIELSPQHAALIFAGSNTLSALTGFFGPFVASALTPNKSYEEWCRVFYLGAAIYAVTGLIFVLFSSSSVQPWSIDPCDIWSSGDLGIEVTPIGKEVEKPAVADSDSSTTNGFHLERVAPPLNAVTKLEYPA